MSEQAPEPQWTQGPGGARIWTAAALRAHTITAPRAPKTCACGEPVHAESDERPGSVWYQS